MKRTFGLLIYLLLLQYSKAADKDWKAMFDSAYNGTYTGAKPLRTIWLNYAKGGSSSGFNFCAEALDALMAIYKATGDKRYIADAVTIINNLMQTASSGNVKNYHNNPDGAEKGWLSLNKAGGHKQLYGQEVPLYESYLFRYFAKFLYLLKTDAALYAIYNDEYPQMLDFLEKSGWQKWYKAGSAKIGASGSAQSMRRNSIFMRSRTHMSAHWGTVALYLSKLTANQEIKQQCTSFLEVLNDRLRKNFRNNPLDNKSFIWNSTWDDALGASVVEDVSHGNHVVSYIVECYAMGVYWTKNDIIKLCNLVKDVLYNTAGNSFYDTLDRSPLTESKTTGLYQSDGWVKLGKYDPAVYNIYQQYANNKKAVTYYNQQGQFFANMALNATVLKK